MAGSSLYECPINQVCITFITNGVAKVLCNIYLLDIMTYALVVGMHPYFVKQHRFMKNRSSRISSLDTSYRSHLSDLFNLTTCNAKQNVDLKIFLGTFSILFFILMW